MAEVSGKEGGLPRSVSSPWDWGDPRTGITWESSPWDQKPQAPPWREGAGWRLQL